MLGLSRMLNGFGLVLAAVNKIQTYDGSLAQVELCLDLGFNRYVNTTTGVRQSVQQIKQINNQEIYSASVGVLRNPE